MPTQGGPSKSVDPRINMMRTMEGRQICEEMRKQAEEVRGVLNDGKIKMSTIYVDPNNATTVVTLDKKSDSDKFTKILEGAGYSQRTDGGSGTTYYRSEQYDRYRVQLGFADKRDGKSALA